MHSPVVPSMVPRSSEQWIVPSVPSLLESGEAVHALAIEQPLPSYPSLHSHSQDPADPLTVPRSLTQCIVPSLSPLLESEEAEHAPAVSQPLPPPSAFAGAGAIPGGSADGTVFR